MADNTDLNAGSGGDKITTREFSHGGDTSKTQGVFLFGISGTEGSYTAAAIDGTAANGLEVDVTRVQGTVTVDGSGVTQPISAASLPLPSGAATAANQLPDGHNVTVDNASGGSAVNIQDGGNEITVDQATHDNLNLNANLQVGDADVAATNPVPTAPDNFVSTINSTTSPLGSGASFAPANGDDCRYYTSVTITLFADQDSATDGMTFEFSTDDTNWDDSYDFTLSAGTTRRFQFPVTARYFRVNYTNGGTGQGAFRVQTILHRHNVLTSIHRLVDNASPDRSAQVVKSALIAQINGTGDFTPIQANAAGVLKIGGSVDVDDISAGTQTNDVKITMDGETVQVQSNSANLATQTTAAAIQTAVEIMDDWDETNRCAVNPVSGQAGLAGGTGTDAANALRVSLATDIPLPAGTNGIGKLTANSGVDIGDVDVTSISAGTNLIGDVGLSGARTSGGTTLYKNIDADESEDQVKGTAGQVYWIHAMNLSSGTRFLKFYNATAATVTVGTTVPDLTFPIPTQGDTNGAGFTLSIPNGIAFGTAITIAATTGVADNDSGAPGANEVVVNLGYA
jgi:hypothetical protein